MALAIVPARLRLALAGCEQAFEFHLLDWLWYRNTPALPPLNLLQDGLVRARKQRRHVRLQARARAERVPELRLEGAEAHEPAVAGRVCVVESEPARERSVAPRP